jgi:hypothetical protein
MFCIVALLLLTQFITNPAQAVVVGRKPSGPLLIPTYSVWRLLFSSAP